MTTAATIAARLILDSTDYNSGLGEAKKKAEGFASDIGKRMQAVGKTMAMAGAGMTAGLTAPIVAFGVKATNAASDLGESINAVDVVFGDAAATIKAFGKTSAEAVGLSEAEFNQLAAEAGSLLQNLGYDAEGAAGGVETLAVRASDMASVFNKDVDQAMGAIQSALKGEFNPLEQFGVKMNAAGIEAKALAMGLGDAEGKLDDNAKAQAALAILYEQTDRIAGDFRNTSDGLANSSRILKAKFMEVSAQIGQMLLPFVTKLVEFGDRLLDKITALSPAFQKVALIGALVVAALGPILTIVGMLVMALGTIITVVGAISVPLIAVFAAIAAAIGVVIGVVFLMVAAWKNNWGGIREAVESAWSNIKPHFDALVAWFKQVIPEAIEVLKGYWVDVLLPAIIDVWVWISENLIPLLTELAIWLLDNIPVALQKLADFWTNTLLPAITNVWAWMSETLMPLLSELLGWLQENLPTALATLADFWENKLQPAIEVVWSFLETYVFPLIKAVAKFIAGFWVAAIKVLIAVFEIVKKRITDFWEALETLVFPIIKDVAAYLDEKFSPAFETLGAAVEGVIGWIGSLGDSLMNIEIPDWLTPGSPTPFEMGIRGIGSAINDLNRAALPELASNLSFSGVNTAGVAGGSGNSGWQQTSVSIPSVSVTITGNANENDVRRGVNLGIADALRGAGLA